MSDDPEVQRLRSIAYGRADGDDARQAAAEAQAELRRLEQRAAAKREFGRPAPHGASPAHDSSAQPMPQSTAAAGPGASTPFAGDNDHGWSVAEASEGGRAKSLGDETSAPGYEDRVASRPHARRGWLIAAAVASALACFGGGYALATSNARATDGPQADSVAPITQGREFLGPALEGVGDREAADRLLLRAAVEKDLQLNSELADFAEAMELVPDSVRLLGTIDEEARVGAARSLDGDLCIVVALTDGTGAGSCATPEDFATRGIMLDSGSLVVTWTGDTFHASIPLGPPTA